MTAAAQLHTNTPTLLHTMPNTALVDYERLTRSIPRPESLTPQAWDTVRATLAKSAIFYAVGEESELYGRLLTSINDFLTNSTATNEDGETYYKQPTKAAWRAYARQLLVDEGLVDEAEAVGEDYHNDVTNIGARARLELIIDTVTKSAAHRAAFDRETTGAALTYYPAWRLLRYPGAKDPRPLHVANEGVVRLKSDFDYWAHQMNSPEIGGFDVPWAPFGFNSYMYTQQVSFAECQRLGLVPQDTTPQQWAAVQRDRMAQYCEHYAGQPEAPNDSYLDPSDPAHYLPQGAQRLTPDDATTNGTASPDDANAAVTPWPDPTSLLLPQPKLSKSLKHLSPELKKHTMEQLELNLGEPVQLSADGNTVTATAGPLATWPPFREPGKPREVVSYTVYNVDALQPLSYLPTTAAAQRLRTKAAKAAKAYLDAHAHAKPSHNGHQYNTLLLTKPPHKLSLQTKRINDKLTWLIDTNLANFGYPLTEAEATKYARRHLTLVTRWLKVNQWLLPKSNNGTRADEVALSQQVYTAEPGQQAAAPFAQALLYRVLPPKLWPKAREAKAKLSKVTIPDPSAEGVQGVQRSLYYLAHTLAAKYKLNAKEVDVLANGFCRLSLRPYTLRRWASSGVFKGILERIWQAFEG